MCNRFFFSVTRVLAKKINSLSLPFQAALSMPTCALKSPSSVQFIYYFSARKKRHTGDNSERAELTKSTATTIVTNKTGVSIDNCTLTQKSKEKVGERKLTWYKLYTVMHILF